MCDAAQEFGLVAFKRTGLLTSIREAPAGFQFVLHARLDVGDTAYGWSYGEMAWYEIPERARQNVDAKDDFDCVTRRFT
ncbi:MAG: hypothetical protein AAFV31_03885 [Pseudomonadota bacterium]